MSTEPRQSLTSPPSESDGNSPAGVAVVMPQVGNTMEEGTIVKWRVKEGDDIKAGQILCEIETDKVTTEVEADRAGRLVKIVAAEGATVPVKHAIAYLAGEGGGGLPIAGATAVVSPVAKSVVAATPVVVAAPTALLAKQETGRRVKASPLARKIAAEKGIDLTALVGGSGPGRRILSTDLASVTGNGLREERPSGEQRRPMSKMRRAIARNLQVSKQTIPHFYVKLTIDADPLMVFYKAQKPATGCTLNDVLLLAVGRLTGELSAFRSRVDGEDVVEMPSANIGIAVSVADGLVVPVVMNVQSLKLGDVAKEARRVVESARAGKLENIGKAVFSISNMGMLEVEEFSAIINPPESGILAISAVREDVIVRNGAMRPGRVMTLVLSIDHRVVDGAMAAQFMSRLRELLEKPKQLPV